jgi:hypothetical protein
MSCKLLYALCFWAQFALCTSCAQYPIQSAMRVQPRCAMLSVLCVHCANVVQFAVRSVFLCPVCAQVALCTCCVQCPITVHSLCVQLVKCVMLSVHGANSPCQLQNAAQCPCPNHPHFSSVQCVSCIVCVQYSPAMGPTVAPGSRRSSAKCVVIV